MIKGKKPFVPLTSQNICEIYNILLSSEYVSFPIPEKAKEKLDSLVENINGSTFGIEHYKTTEEKIIAYLYFIIKNHPFIDGNKRTAVMVAFVLCKLHETFPVSLPFTFDELAIYLESYSGDDHQDLIRRVALAVFGNN